MAKNLKGKTAAIIAILVIFLYGIFGIPKHGLKQALHDNINLGLDLRGGVHLVLQVHTNDAITDATDRDVQSLQTALASAGVTGATVSKPDPTGHPETIAVTGVPLNHLADARGVFNGTGYAQYDVTSGADGSFTLTMKASAISDLRARTVATSIETITQRVNALGVSETTVAPYGLGADQILVEIPGYSDTSHIEEIIQSTAKLEIHEVVGTSGYPDQAAALAANGGALPPDEELVKGEGSAGAGDQVWVLKRASVVAGTDFRDAQPSQDENGRPDITFNLTTDAGDRFYKFTDEHKGTGMMAIVLENQVREVATIQGAIRDSGRITGGFTPDQAKDLSLMLRTGSLPASIGFLETRTVGPTLGAASIRQGVLAAVAGMSAVLIFMLIYYKAAGINADLALLLNLVILLGFMGYTHAVLTLPGIAGLILTIGMGVDSNVLIFERIREELRAGKTALSAVDNGFKHAWVTIVDTHVTTIVSAAILFIFGSGPVKGFAVTLTFGLLANLFTAVFVSRLIFDTILGSKQRDAQLSI